MSGGAADHAFSRGTVWALAAVVVGSLAVAVALVVLGSDPAAEQPAGADAYSTSAIGHRGLVEMLRRLDIPVVVSRHDSAAKARGGLIILAEPATLETAQLQRMTATAHEVLVVLPKWRGYTIPGQRWIDRAARLSPGEVESVLRVALDDDDARVASAAAIDSLNAGALPTPRLTAAQLVDESNAEARVSGPAGALVVSRETASATRITVLADPDVLNNAGLREAANAQFTVALIDELRAGGPVIFDETIHGHEQSPSFWRVLFRFPLVLATLQVMLCAALAIWAAMVRFGPAKAPPPPLAPGKDFLIRSTAALLRFGGHHSETLRRYLTASELAVRRELHAPQGLSRTAIVAWLDRLGADRGITTTLAVLQSAVAAPTTPADAVHLADAIHRWRHEMTHGPRKHS